MLIPRTSVRGSKPTPQGFPKTTRNWLERLPAGTISTWKDLTTRFLAEFFPPRRTAKKNSAMISMFQQHYGESLSEAMDSFQELTTKMSSNHGIDFGSNGPHDTQYCMENPEQAFVEYASSRTNEAGDYPEDENTAGGTRCWEEEVEYFDIFPTRSELAYHNISIYTLSFMEWNALPDFFALVSSEIDFCGLSEVQARIRRIFLDGYDVLVFSIWKAFGGNTRDLGSFGEEMDKTTDLHQHLSRISTQKLGTASQITRDAITTHTKMASQDLKTAS
ncbi:zinc finger, CCHC-type containing protein [Tanacetum coccineum]